MNRMKTVVPMDNHRLQVLMENGEYVVLDFNDRLKTARFGILEDTSFFEKATTDGIIISWQGKVEISITEVLSFGKNS